MKKVLLIFIIAASTAAMFSSCKKAAVKGCTNADAINYDSKATEDDGNCIAPLQVHKTILLDFTGTQCGNCSAYGIPCFMQAIKDNPNKTVPLSVHCGTGDPLNNNVSLSMSGGYNVSGTPTMAVGNNPNVSIDAASLNSAITTGTTGTTSVGMCSKMSVSGTVLSISARLKFFSACTGEYWFAVYALENGVVSPQISLPDPYTHFHVLRGCVNQLGGYRGEKVVTTSIAAGSIIDKSYTYTVPAGCNPANMYLACVLWKKEATSWTFINGN
ncbi:MAG: Omp28-related outer membrane protein [Bacteroidota bacterium]